MKGDFKTLLRKFCLESSVMGLKYFYLYPDPLSRCFWAVSIVFTLFMAFTLSLLLHYRFAALPTRIMIENQYTPIKNVSYPAITICSPNQVTLKAVRDLERTLVDGNRSSIDLKSFLPQLLGFYVILRDIDTQALNDFESLIRANRYSAQDIMHLLPQKCDDFLKLCYLKGQLYPNCKGLFSPILTKHGMCCIFNSVYEYDSNRGNKRLKDFVPHTADTGGIGEALTVVTDYNPDSALSGTLLIAGAVRTSFTDPYEFPADDESNLVHAYTESFHSIHATYTYCSEDVTALAYWRCFWAVSIVFTLFMAFTLSLLLHYRFAALPTRIMIENQYTPIKNVSYPAITICSPNQVTLKAVRDLERTLVDGNRSSIDLKSFLPQLLGFYVILRDIDTQALNDFESLIRANRYSAQDIMHLLPQKCDDFLKLCYLKGQLYPNCKGLFSPILTKHGMCCIFNSVYEYDSNRGNKRLKDFVPHTADTGGIGEALTVVTDYNPDSALSGTLLIAGAVRTSFTDPYEFPADDESNLVHAYTESFHSIHATYTYCSEDVTALAYWSRQCYFSNEHQLKHFAGYRNSDCDLLCVVQGIERRCGCSELYVPHVWRAHACNITSIDCILNAKRQMNRWYNSGSCDCLRDCESTRYHVEVSVGNLMALPHIIHEPYSGIQFNMSTSIQHFFFRSSVHVKQKQETVMSLISLSSNLGGVFGLCLGCSVISVLEIFFYVYCAIRNKIQRLREHKNKKRFPLYYNEIQKKR